MKGNGQLILKELYLTNKKFMMLCVSFLIIGHSAFAQRLGYDDFVLYRNDPHNFRIKFTKGWLIRDGDGRDVVKKALDDTSGGNINIVVKTYQGSDPIRCTVEEFG